MSIMPTRKLGNRRGIALVVVLLVMVVFAVLGGAFIARTVNEKNIAERDKLLNQAFFVAEAGAEAGLAKIDELINSDLLTTVNASNPNVFGNKAGTYANTNDGLGFLVDYVKKVGVAQLTRVGSEATFTSSLIAHGAGAYSYKVILTPKSNPVTVATDIWDFPFFYQIQATGTVNNNSRKVRLDGDITIRVQRDNFAKYALFTDHHRLPAGTTVWFTNKTDFAGPLHTNERYSFAFNPSGIFDGAVTQHHNTARFYNNGFPILADADSNGNTDVPVFNSTFTRGASQIVLASSVQQQDLYDQAKGTLGGNPSGIHVPNSAGVLTGGIWVRGDATIDMSVNASGNAVYTIASGGVTKTVEVDRSANQTTVTTSGVPVTYSGIPEGVDKLGTIIYVDGNINGLKGTVQKDTEVTVSGQYSINITDNIKYEEYTPAVGNPGDAGYQPPTAADKGNLLGILAWGGNVNIASTAPNNVEIHGIVMARNGIFQVNNYDNVGVGPRGTATLLGGVITQFYGAFGLFDGTTGASISGYNRNFIYDSRTLMGKSPPYFPSMRTFIAFTNDLTDKVAYQEGGF